MNKLWLCLIILRIIWSLLPQTGYIHPDEFFQTVEPVAGDAFNISIERTWEFNNTYQLRSVTLPQLVFRPVFMCLSYLENSTSFKLSSYHVLASYRFIMTVFSLIIDLCVYKVCLLLDLPHQTALTLLASSYVILTFQTHTFSNSFETLLISILLVCIVKCKKACNDNDQCNHRHRREVTNYDDDNNSNDDDCCDLDSSFNNLHRVAFELRKRNKSGQSTETVSCEEKDSNTNKTKTQMESKVSGASENITENVYSGYMYTTFIAITLVIGVFNRPTFVLFSIVPCLWWLSDFISNISLLIKRGLVFLLVAMATISIFILIDTLYYNSMNLHEFLMYENWVQSLVFVPVNFILYNSVSTNLASHGLHPYYVHFTVNMSLLYLPYLFCIAKYFIYKFVSTCSKTNVGKSEISESKTDTKLKKYDESQTNCVHNISYIFLCFLYFPVLCLSIFPHQEARFLTPLLPFIVICVVTLQQKFNKMFWLLFVMFNIFFSVIFGVLHQGGIIPCLFYIQQYYSTNFNNNNTLHVVFSHTYMPPKHLLMSNSSNLKLYDLKGESLDHVFDKLINIRLNDFQDSKSNINDKLFLVVPGTVISSFEAQYHSHISYNDKVTFFPHLSFEDLPILNTIDSMHSLYDQLSLKLLDVSIS